MDKCDHTWLGRVALGLAEPVGGPPDGLHIEVAHRLSSSTAGDFAVAAAVGVADTLLDVGVFGVGVVVAG